MQNITLNIQGMTCSGCVKSIQNILNATQGVLHAEVNLNSAQATIEFNPTQTSIQTLIEAIEEAGFEAQAA